MIITKEFIWMTDHYVCHITEEKNMFGIMEKGLLPLNGERCSFVLDNRKGVFCLDGVHNVQYWANALYETFDLDTLKLLRFNLKRRKWYIDNSNEFALGFYLPNKVLPERIDYLQMKDKNGDILPLTKLLDLDFLYQIKESFNSLSCNQEIIVDDCNLSWEPIIQYKKEKVINIENNFRNIKENE